MDIKVKEKKNGYKEKDKEKKYGNKQKDKEKEDMQI